MLEVIYLIFNEGYSATAGDDWMRPALCEDALRLGRILAGLVPKEPEVHGLVALMEIQASRTRARIGPTGEPILLLDQNRARWDQLLIRRGLAALAARRGHWAARSAPTPCRPRSPPATRERAPPSETDWPRIAALYDALAQLAPSPVVELNRAVAVSMAFGPAAGLSIVDALIARAVAEGVPPPAQRARRPPVQARPHSTKRALSSSAPRRSRAMRGSGRCCSSAWPHACARAALHPNPLPTAMNLRRGEGTGFKSPLPTAASSPRGEG